MSFGHYYKYFGKKTKFKSKNTTPGEQKGDDCLLCSTTA